MRPWKLCSSAITPVLPVALRAYFSAASFASAPELQKNACAPPKRSESAAASTRAGSVPIEVRRVPEPVELRVRGGERRRVAVAEPDDGDARGEVEVRAARVVDEPDAVALDERDARRRIRRQQRVLQRGAHATTAVTPMSAASPFRAAMRGREQLRDDAAVEDAAVDERSARGRASIEWTSSPSW